MNLKTERRHDEAKEKRERFDNKYKELLPFSKYTAFDAVFSVLSFRQLFVLYFVSAFNCIVYWFISFRNWQCYVEPCNFSNLFLWITIKRRLTMGTDTDVACNGPFSRSETLVIKTVTFIGAGLSIFGCLMIIFSYWYFYALRTFPYRLIMFLTVANLFSSIGYFLGEIGLEDFYDVECSENLGCIISAVVTQFFDVANFFWTSIIAFNIYMVIGKSTLMIFFHVLIISVRLKLKGVVE